MLSAKKIKLHGMQSRRWTVKDKLTQYKGLISLYTRDRKILDYDHNLLKKKQIATLQELQTNIINCRANLDNASRGNRQALRNVLQEHKELQLAYQDLHPTKVIEYIFQSNCSKRKELDRVRYVLKCRSELLIHLKLELAELQDRLKMEAMFGQIKEEEEAQIITGKVQDAILRKDAAIVVRNTYKSILNIMKRDSIYFDAVLDTIKNDAMAQGRCMYRTTELGQLATEYLDDRKDEFLTLEKQIKAEMKVREADLEKIRAKVSKLGNNLRTLIRRESDVTVIKRTIQKTASMDYLQQDVDYLEVLLNQLKTATMVSTFELIFPCMETQKDLAERLAALAQEMTERRDIVNNKYVHGKKMLSTLEFTMVDTTFEYKATKKDCLENINMEAINQSALEAIIQKKGELITNIRKSLQNIFNLCKHVHDEKMDSSQDMPQSKEMEKDGSALVIKIRNKLQTLLPQVPKFHLSPNLVYNISVEYQNMLHMYSTVINPLQKQTYESLVELQMDDSKVPTRESIKAASDEVIKEHLMALRHEEMVVEKRQKKFKLK